MHQYLVEVTGTLSGESQEEHLDGVMEALIDMIDDRVFDPSISFDRSVSRTTIEVTVNAANIDDAAGIGTSAVRTAIHAAGGATPDWPQHTESTWSMSVDEVRSAVPA